MKLCVKCKEEKPESEFDPVKGGLRSVCKQCTLDVRAYALKIKYYQHTRFKCCKCLQIKAKYKFGARSANIYGLDYFCKECRAQVVASEAKQVTYPH